MSTQSEFRSALQRAVELAVEWRHDGVKLPAIPTATKEQLMTLLDIELGDEGRDGVAVIEQLAAAAEHGLANNTHPNFYSWVQGSSHTTGVAADVLTSAWGQNVAFYQMSPAAAIAEEVAAKWLLDLLQLPAESSVSFSTGATMASFICLSAARSEVLHRVGYDLEQDGIFDAPGINVFIGEEAHATILADLRYLGFGDRQLVRVDADDQGRMIAADLKEKMSKLAGPAIVVAQAGHINSGAFDPFVDIVSIAKGHNAWLHVDGAFGLWARAVPSLGHHCAGIEGADSWTVDGHKWLQVPYDSGFAIVKHEQALRRAMDITASYLVADPEDGRNPSEYGPELSRRARGFTVWAVLQAFGRDGIQEMISRHCRCAKHLQSRLSEEPGINVLNDVVLNQLAISFGRGDDSLATQDSLTLATIEDIRKQNSNFVRGATWKGQQILRISISAWLTDIEHIDSLADAIILAWRKVARQAR